MTDPVTPEKLRELAGHAILIPSFSDEGQDEVALEVSVALRAAADEIERLADMLHVAVNPAKEG